MIICFTSDEETRDRLDHLVEHRGHASYDDVIRHAVALYSSLSSQMGKERVLVLIGDEEPLAASAGEEPIPQPVQVPPMFRATEQMDAPVGESPVDGNGEITPRDWVFGQYNKLLPMKAGLRAVAHTISAVGRSILEIEELAEAGLAAVELTRFLQDRDEECGSPRDELLATGFPSVEGEESSRRRFQGHFMFDMSGQRTLQGLAAEYGFVGFVGGSPEGGVSLTERGWEFVEMANPLLDDTDRGSCCRFSEMERALLLDTIASAVPKERAAFMFVAEGITVGADNPTDLDRYLHDMMPDEIKSQVTPSYLSTQRSGAVSRFGDIGLISRQRKGVRVEYILTDAGEAFRNSLRTS